MVGEFGTVMVMDWGLARPVEEERRELVIAGTLGYMSPEQARGDEVDPRSDVFSLGVMLSFLLADDDIPRPLAAVIARARSANPSARYAGAADLAEDLLRFLDGEPVTAYRENILERTARWLARNRVLVALITAYLVMRVIVFFWVRH